MTANALKKLLSKVADSTLINFCAEITKVAAVIAALAATVVSAQTPQNTSTAEIKAIAASAPVNAPMAALKPTWADITPKQRQSLKPLMGTWETMSEGQKRKWLEISKNYPALSLADQATMHSRMNEWVALSPQERAQARLNFATTKELSKQLSAEEKKAKWQSYQALSLDEKQKLAAKGTPKPTGAATAVKPVAPQKLAVTPKNSTYSSIDKPAQTDSAPASTVQPAAGPASTTPAAVVH